MSISSLISSWLVMGHLRWNDKQVTCQKCAQLLLHAVINGTFLETTLKESADDPTTPDDDVCFCSNYLRALSCLLMLQIPVCSAPVVVEARARPVPAAARLDGRARTARMQVNT